MKNSLKRKSIKIKSLFVLTSGFNTTSGYPDCGVQAVPFSTYKKFGREILNLSSTKWRSYEVKSLSLKS
jgi:hypothetical protein